MNRIIALLIVALLAALPALAEGASDDPFGAFADERPVETDPRSDAASDESFPLTVGGETVRLGFDASPLYSSVQGGTVQASYYAYGSDGVTLYELYICFPDTAKPGMVITPEYGLMTGEDSSVSLIVSTNAKDQTYYFSSLADGVVYPVDSTFSVSIDGIEESGGETTYSGRLSATLIALDMISGATAATLEIPETPFRFTLGGSSQQRNVPASTPVPSDMRKV